MTYSLTYTIAGSTYTLNGYDPITGLTFGYGGDNGFGLAPLHRITQRGPMQHGDTDDDFRLDPRVLQLPLIVSNFSFDEYYQIRQKLLTLFSPSNVPGILTVTLPTGEQRSIMTKVLGGLTLDYSGTDNYTIRTVLQLRADDPTWYDPVVNTLSLTPVSSGTAMPIPLVIPLTMGSTTINSATTVVNGGSWAIYPVIQATGSITNFSITNSATGLTIATSGTIPAGRTWTIDLRYGYKTVYDDLGVNQISAITTSSSLSTFAIAPAPTVVGGVNTLVINSTANGSTASVIISYYIRYIGI